MAEFKKGLNPTAVERIFEEINNQKQNEVSSLGYYLKALDKHDENPKTRLPGENAYERYTQNYDNRRPYNLIATYIDLTGFGEINRNIGHEAADIKLEQFASHFRENLRPDDVVFHLHGDEFVLFSIPTKRIDKPNEINQPNKNDLKNSLNGLKNHLNNINNNSEIKFNSASIIFNPEKHKSIKDAVNEADLQLMEQKKIKREQKSK